MGCAICGAEEKVESRGRWWDSDDGWRFAPLCDYCWEDVRGEKPKPDDYAVATKQEYGEAAFADDAEWGGGECG
jgi:hypothetical protein